MSPSAQSVVTGDAASVSARLTASTPVGALPRTLYYKWTVASVSSPGVPVLLGGDNTATVGFVTPTAPADTTIVLRVAMGYYPISVSNPGVYFVDSVVVINAAR